MYMKKVEMNHIMLKWQHTMLNIHFGLLFINYIFFMLKNFKCV